MLVSKWGNSLAIRIPQEVVTALELVEGDDVEVIADKKRFTIVRKPTRAEILERMRRDLGVRLPKDFHFDREEANARK